MKKTLIYLFSFMIVLYSTVSFAADQTAKEETTPPPLEGPLTINQIAPFNSFPLANKTKTMPVPASPAATPSVEQAPPTDSTGVAPAGQF